MTKSQNISAHAGASTQTDLMVFEPWLTRWNLVTDGEPFASNWSRLLPVRRDGEALMLKAAMAPSEIQGSGFLEWLDGAGAAKVHAREDDAVLLERITGPRSLVAMENDGDIEGALRVLCEVGAAIHKPRAAAPPSVLYSFQVWFAHLNEVAALQGGILLQAAQMAERLLADPQDIRALHGDLHHENVLDGGVRGWLAIDPKGLWGERAFDFALMVLPPNLEQDADPGVLWQRAHLIGKLAEVDPQRLLQWVMVQAALWASWAAPIRDWIAITQASVQALDEF